PSIDLHSVAGIEGELSRREMVHFFLDLRIQRGQGTLTRLLEIELLRVVRVHRDEGNSVPLHVEALHAPLTSNHELCFLSRPQTKEVDRASVGLKEVNEISFPQYVRGSVRLRPHVAVQGVRLVSVSPLDLDRPGTAARADD